MAPVDHPPTIPRPAISLCRLPYAHIHKPPGGRRSVLHRRAEPLPPSTDRPDPGFPRANRHRGRCARHLGPAPTAHARCTRVTQPAPAPHEDSPLLTIDAHPGTERALRAITTKILNAVPCADVTHFSACLAGHLTPTSWKAALRLLPALEYVYLSSDEGELNFLRALLEIEEVDPEHETYPRLECLHLCFAKEGEGDETILAIFAQLKIFLGRADANWSRLRVLEIEELRWALVEHDERLTELFSLIAERFVRNGKVYDPATEPEEREKRLAEWEAYKVAEQGPVYKLR
ncbi:hypothetical protein FB451DRAFT_448183 [Mycena latifolia]|nr:hypothetical protein FB451DRAFT_448183 [Mycena latifolia]